VIIARAGKPISRLVSSRDARKCRKFGLLAGNFFIPEDFDEPLPKDVFAYFEAREDAFPRGHPCVPLGDNGASKPVEAIASAA
jgi:hypothetical protein